MSATSLCQIPQLTTSEQFATELPSLKLTETLQFLDAATHPFAFVPRFVSKVALATLDPVGRRFLETHTSSRYMRELGTIANLLRKPGTFALHAMFESMCTTYAGPAKGGNDAQLVRVLDWRTPGLGTYAYIVHVKGPRSWVALTWPGFVGVIQGMVPGKFAVALNQAPMPRHYHGVSTDPFGTVVSDWFFNRVRTWRTNGKMPAHLIREICEQAGSYAEALDLLQSESLCIPGIFSIVGTQASEHAVVERVEDRASITGKTCAANHFDTPGWGGRPRGEQSTKRARIFSDAPEYLSHTEFQDPPPPVLNVHTKIVAVMNPARGSVSAVGYENMIRVTQVTTVSFKT